MVDVGIEAEGTGSDEEVARIASRIRDCFAKSLAIGEGRYYLARLGSDLGSDRNTLEMLTGKKLVSFVQDALGYEIEREGKHGNIIVVKLGGPAVSPKKTVRSIPRYAPRFWAAFRVPLVVEGTRRFINLGSMVFAAEQKEVSNGEGEVREIDPRFIVQDDGPVEPSVIADNIERWLEEQGIDPAPFLIQKKDAHREERSLLDEVIMALSGEQLKRVTLPLDVVKALKDQSA